MGKKKHPEHVNHERWLVSYADFITLLFAFFVVLFASGQADKKKQQALANAFQNAFSQMALFPQAAKTPSMANPTGSNPNASPKPLELPIDSDGSGDSMHHPDRATPIISPEELARRMTEAVKKQLADGTLKGADLTIRKVPDGVVLSLHEGGFFDSGSADLRPEAVAILKSITASLPDQDIRVEGHTDNVPIHSAMYATNWELSSARASTIARFLLEHSTLNPTHLAVAGYAEFRPVVSNATPEGRARNRRVDIVFLKPPPPEPAPTPATKAEPATKAGSATKLDPATKTVPTARTTPVKTPSAAGTPATTAHAAVASTKTPAAPKK